MSTDDKHEDDTPVVISNPDTGLYMVYTSEAIREHHIKLRTLRVVWIDLGVRTTLSTHYSPFTKAMICV